MDHTQGFDAKPRKETNPADVQLGEIFAEITTLLDNAVGVTWYEESGNAVDQAVVALCRLRRAGAASRGGPEAGDVAVRDALALSDPGAVIWLASRTISYIDESGWPAARSRTSTSTASQSSPESTAAPLRQRDRRTRSTRRGTAARIRRIRLSGNSCSARSSAIVGPVAMYERTALAAAARSPSPNTFPRAARAAPSSFASLL